MSKRQSNIMKHQHQQQ